jgi:hypothetical protein
MGTCERNTCEHCGTVNDPALYRYGQAPRCQRCSWEIPNATMPAEPVRHARPVMVFLVPMDGE